MRLVSSLITEQHGDTFKCAGIHTSIMCQSILQRQSMAMYGDPGSSGPGESEQGANAALTELEKGLRLAKLLC